MIHNISESIRMEIKFIAYSTLYHNLLYWLRIHPAEFYMPYSDRWVNNIYFDTHDGNAYKESLSGASTRTKVRYRWYGNSEIPEAGTLEIKQKCNCYGWKKQFKIDRPPYKPGASWQTIRQKMSDQLHALGKQWVDTSPVPVFINRYHRRYLASGDGKIRVTLDSKHSVWEQRLRAYPNFIHRAYLPDIFVVEFKFHHSDIKLASQILRRIPIRRSRHSKFIWGVKAIAGI